MKHIRLFACIIAFAMLSLFALADSAVICRSAFAEASVNTGGETGILLSDIPLDFTTLPSEIRKAFVLSDGSLLVQYSADTDSKCLFAVELFAPTGESLWQRVFEEYDAEDAWSAYATAYPDGDEIVCEAYANLEFLSRMETRYRLDGEQVSRKKVTFSNDGKRTMIALPSFSIEHFYIQNTARITCLSTEKEITIDAFDAGFFELEDGGLLIVDEPGSENCRFRLLDPKDGLSSPVTLPLSWWDFLCAAGTSEDIRLFYACDDNPGQIAVYAWNPSMNTAPRLLSTSTLGEDVRVKQAFLAENGYVLLLREDNSERLVLLGDDAVFTPLSESLPVAFSPVQGSEAGVLSLILYDEPNQGYRLVSFGVK